MAGRTTPCWPRWRRNPSPLGLQVVDLPAGEEFGGTHVPRQTGSPYLAVIRVVGVGGGGSNAVNRMVEAGVQGVEFIAVNTDNQALQMSAAMRRIPIGGRSAKGLGAGGDPDMGERAAEISRDALTDMLEGADMVFITAGLGGGTGPAPRPSLPTWRAAPERSPSPWSPCRSIRGLPAPPRRRRGPGAVCVATSTR